MVSIGQTDNEFLMSLKNKITDEHLSDFIDDHLLFNMPDTCRGRTIQAINGGQTVIRIPHKIETFEQHGTLAHEIFHAVEFILRRINIKLSKNSDECFAYLIGYVTSQVYKYI